MSKENKRLHLHINILGGYTENLMVAVMGRWTEGFQLEGFIKYTVTFEGKKKKKAPKAKRQRLTKSLICC